MQRQCSNKKQRDIQHSQGKLKPLQSLHNVSGTPVKYLEETRAKESTAKPTSYQLYYSGVLRTLKEVLKGSEYCLGFEMEKTSRAST
jgi:hypothetical protein